MQQFCLLYLSHSKALHLLGIPRIDQGEVKCLEEWKAMPNASESNISTLGENYSLGY